MGTDLVAANLYYLRVRVVYGKPLCNSGCMQTIRASLHCQCWIRLMFVAICITAQVQLFTNIDRTVVYCFLNKNLSRSTYSE
jgi:hypothetical protein